MSSSNSFAAIAAYASSSEDEDAVKLHDGSEEDAAMLSSQSASEDESSEDDASESDDDNIEELSEDDEQHSEDDAANEDDSHDDEDHASIAADAEDADGKIEIEPIEPSELEEMMKEQELPPRIQIPERQPKRPRKDKSDTPFCEVCNTKNHKYRCPGCEMLYCSVDCFKKHKIEFKCSGTRSKTHYVDIPEFNDAQLLSDYYFLEETQRLSDSVKRLKRQQPKLHLFAKDLHKQKQPLPFKLSNLQKQAKFKLDARIYFMPPGMKKRDENTTYYDIRKQKIFWRVELKFPSAEFSTTEDRIDGDAPLRDTLVKFIEVQPGNAVVRQKLMKYCKEKIEDLVLLMPVEKIKSNEKVYYKLALDQSLNNNLKHKCIIEYPTIHVVLPSTKSSKTDVVEGNSETIETYGDNNEYTVISAARHEALWNELLAKEQQRKEYFEAKKNAQAQRTGYYSAPNNNTSAGSATMTTSTSGVTSQTTPDGATQPAVPSTSTTPSDGANVAQVSAAPATNFQNNNYNHHNYNKRGGYRPNHGYNRNFWPRGGYHHHNNRFSNKHYHNNQSHQQYAASNNSTSTATNATTATTNNQTSSQ